MDYDKLFEMKLKENQKYFDLFEEEMKKEGLSNKTIKRHLRNAEFYVNHFVNHYEVYDMNKGCYELDTYFGPFYKNLKPDFTVYTLKENVSSIKKFYKTMYKHNLIDHKDYDELISTTKIMMDEWLECCQEDFTIDV